MSTEKIIAFAKPYESAGRMWNGGYVMVATGPQCEFELDQVGRDLDEWFICEVAPTTGILVWEGACINYARGGYDWEPDMSGRWRLPTDEELRSLVPEPEQTCDTTGA